RLQSRQQDDEGRYYTLHYQIGSGIDIVCGEDKDLSFDVLALMNARRLSSPSEDRDKCYFCKGTRGRPSGNDNDDRCCKIEEDAGAAS
ncbi:unnamed protein product, partial [Amoebophrya sp. A25]